MGYELVEFLLVFLDFLLVVAQKLASGHQVFGLHQGSCYLFRGEDEGGCGVAAISVEARPLVVGTLRLLSLFLELLAPAHRQHCTQISPAVLVQWPQRKAVRVALASGRILIVLHFINNYYGTHAGPKHLQPQTEHTANHRWRLVALGLAETKRGKDVSAFVWDF